MNDDQRPRAASASQPMLDSTRDPRIARDARSRTNRISAAILIGAVIVAGTVALTRKGTVNAPEAHATDSTQGTSSFPTNMQTTGSTLPPGHPVIANDGTNNVAAGVAGNVAGLPSMQTPIASVTWTVPTRWEQVPHASAMRIATYRIPHAVGDFEDAELSVTRAGGDTEANIERWLGQFDEVGRKTAKRSERTVEGLRVVIVEVQGDYAGMGGESEKGFAMLSAIVETEGTKHFFKMIGPQKSVLAARVELDALVSSIKPR